MSEGTGKYIVCKNSRGSEITFKYDFPYWVTSIDGLHEVAGKIASVQSAFGVGTSYVGTTINPRNIVIKGNVFEDYQNARDKLRELFLLKDTGTLYYYEGSISRKINYYVESFDFSEHDRPREFEVSLICPNPYYSDIENTLISTSQYKSLFKFPFQIPVNEGMKFGLKNNDLTINVNNKTSVDLGLTIVFIATGMVTGVTLTNVITQEKMRLNTTLNPGAKIVITTGINNKKIKSVTDDGKEYIITNMLSFDSTWVTAPPYTESIFIPSATSGIENLTTMISYNQQYEAV